ncbi:cysteine--tRNA ligase [Candidatus Roizmanbacteria bacterium RIFCSPLOWO2_12_FULL_40_12]|uniref:Cysteine--tRNA ligase n=1 Tax=Candidatus Roizmanbacteria bacterium RIFCSPLOWO2_01_FULL_40_42 TaxID=1802066 RepID=A0A1F7J5H6_9BACT|nr:MAG: cysteine--tRNA ligase [Candidatus Roizmanbacteria bacterium RIFCSPHIGHO2_01_FULL_40_98]OGK28308.1 MAG: cysteine--tRNA ligase [Candidatus Roizmanbacteria bacterium RIFCSPHIGHO2_02_FULL_40_53]OGK30544.1 MAG: cysteine--tRNA ligase [Candidatus Roizmanbacteria bacterium RIFCSPHIGHO2_12_41_18]OGK36958.1 MAG: cysteine--tRNA ligase [Candidatus Roizmanbacteria bacterium RIFCSPHIGHO2_12_FULL_40_130]OGK50864.1 MAG: cysteine--tRNA ligase [Candidatus Roizmanbacteria bacterium RIFCSPLOWO2_01_FULL_40_
MKLYNSLSRKIEELKPLKPPLVTLYACGPTVYDYTHIGHLRTYTNIDLLRRSFEYQNFNVKHVMNITDVGHLTGDDDSGEDKLEKKAKGSGKTVWEVAKFYADFFEKSLKALNVLLPKQLVKATDHIKDMIALIQQLQEKGFTYETKEAVYFDTSKFSSYGKLSGQKLTEKLQQARKEVHIDAEKKSPSDFALWFKKQGRFADHEMSWESPWGEGFPGWHIECSAMSMKYLGETIDIHAGGIDHLPVHHENEIAQSEAATGKPFVKIWFHNEFLLVDGQKMSKSLNNFYTIDDVAKKKIESMALRLLFLQTHYRKQMNFTWEAVQAAQLAYRNLQDQITALRQQKERTSLSEDKLSKVDDFRKRFVDATSSDLQIPQALAIMWELLKSNVPSPDKLDLVLDFDQVLGLELVNVKKEQLPQNILELQEKINEARKEKNFEMSDKYRKELEDQGFIVEDTSSGTIVKKK